jgi:hypothetical protein
VFETCDTAGWVHDVCTALGTATTVASANDERWRWRRVKRKTNTPFREPATTAVALE